jgi:hypothetical protein
VKKFESFLDSILLKESTILKYFDFINEYSNPSVAGVKQDPLGVAVLGAPAGGKSWTSDQIKNVAGDSRINRTMEKGVSLTVDKLRAEFQSQNPNDQLRGFVHAFYIMKGKAKTNPTEFGKWFQDIKNLWINKIIPLMPNVKVQVAGEELLFNGKNALTVDDTEMFKNVDCKKIIDSLDQYQDYKRVVRYFQSMKQQRAISKSLDISYDEAGDEPNKIVGNMKELDKKGYVTDVFLIHPHNIASNIIQNYYRVTTGGDGGRDSSGSIIQAYNDIEKNKAVYTKNAQEVVDVKSTELKNIAGNLQKANVADDASRGNKPIDVLANVQPREPEQAFQDSLKAMNPDQQNVFKALLRYAAHTLQGLPQNAKDSLLNLTKDIDNNKTIQILEQALNSGKYKFAYGGVTPEIVQKAKQIFGQAAPVAPAPANVPPKNNPPSKTATAPVNTPAPTPSPAPNQKQAAPPPVPPKQ